MKANEAMKGTGITHYTVISKGPRKAELILTLEGGNTVTRHVLLRDGVWRDKAGNTFEVN